MGVSEGEREITIKRAHKGTTLVSAPKLSNRGFVPHREGQKGLLENHGRNK